MVKKVIKMCFSIILLSGMINLYAQEVVTSSGGNIKGNGSVSYTIGQIVYETKNATSGTITEGVQQPFEISIVSGIEQADNIRLNFKAFPNPTSEFFILKVSLKDYNNLTYKIYNSSGTKLMDKEINSDETIINIEDFASSVYFLKVNDNKKELITYKIIKK